MMFSSQRGADGGDKIIARLGLEYVAQRARGQALLHQFSMTVYGHKHDARSGISSQNHAGSRDTVEAGHGDVGDDDIGGEGFGQGNERVAVSDSTDHLELRLQQRSQVFEDLR